MINKLMALAAGLVSFAGASPIAARDNAVTDLYWPVTEFQASKPHLSVYVNYHFKIALPKPDSPVLECRLSQDAGSSGATSLPYVWPTASPCKDAAANVVENMQWTFSQAAPDQATPAVSKDATFNVTYTEQQTVYSGTYVIPGSQIYVYLNDEANPFDNDVGYGGPQEFRFTDIQVAV
ncbi:hypothetical protein PG996_009004 [Apiospora saccharicola]|uniref:Ubiquitin 3 binding protein But2 C-terminal domain-containing protein n=1 Tax=Apiospora saccharicola TaxID=335842 RepID=A0ABR1UMI6_9PEZI